MAYLGDEILPTTPKKHHLNENYTDLRMYLPNIAYEGDTIAERKTFTPIHNTIVDE